MFEGDSHSEIWSHLTVGVWPSIREIEQKEKLEAVSWQLLRWSNHCLALVRSLFPAEGACKKLSKIFFLPFI